MRKQANGEVFRITGARQGLGDDVRGRQRRYVISMSVRTLSVVLAALLWNVERYVAIVALILGTFLPYVAVVIANAGRENIPSLPSTFVPSPGRPRLTTGPDEREAAEGAPRSAQAESDTERTGYGEWSGRTGEAGENPAYSAAFGDDGGERKPG